MSTINTPDEDDQLQRAGLSTPGAHNPDPTEQLTDAGITVTGEAEASPSSSLADLDRFDGEVAFVTGAGSGIARAVALRLAQRGATVVCADINADANQATVASIQAAGGNASGITLDVGDSAAVTAAFAEADVRYGRLDVLINGAALIRFTPLEDCSDEEWDLVMRVGINSCFYTLRAAYPYFRKTGGGRVVQISSSSAKSGSSFGGAHYTAAKGGIVSLSKYAARRWAKDGIRVNTVCPGITDTGIGRDPDAPKTLAAYAADVPLGIAQPDDIADPIVFLASNASRHVTGITFDVNGGREIYGN